MSVLLFFLSCKKPFEIHLTIWMQQLQSLHIRNLFLGRLLVCLCARGKRSSSQGGLQNVFTSCWHRRVKYFYLFLHPHYTWVRRKRYCIILCVVWARTDLYMKFLGFLFFRFEYGYYSVGFWTRALNSGLQFQISIQLVIESTFYSTQ